MYMFLIVAAIVASLFALGATLMIARTESNKIKEYEKTGDSAAAQLQRSNEYEKDTLKVNLPILGIIYALTFLGFLVFILVILFG